MHDAVGSVCCKDSFGAASWPCKAITMVTKRGQPPRWPCIMPFHGSLVLRHQTNIFLQGIITFSICTRKNIGSDVVSIAKSFLTPPS